MSVDWISTTVGEYSPFTYGKAIKKADQLNGGIPVYGSNGVYAFSAEALVKQHAVIIGRKGSVGKVHLSTKPCWISDTAFHTTKNTIEEAYFVYYLLSSLGLEDMNTDAAVPGLNRNNAHRLEIKIPNSVEGRIALVAPLITLDKKIELNRQTNQTLEQIAQAIFKSWFVDFEPTRAKVITKAQGAEPATQELAAQAIISGAITLEQLQGYAEESVEESAQQREQESLSTRLQKAINEKLSQASANPLNATTAEQLIATAALFPNELVESELGEVPEGWELKPFSEYAKVTKGKNITKKNAVPGNVPVVAGGLLPAYWHNVHNVEGPVITISASGANAGYVNLYNQNIWSSDSSYIDKKSTSYFYTAYVCLKYYQKAIYDMQTGAAQPHIYPKDFERLNVVFGSDKLLEQLENLLFSFFEKTANLTNEAETLTQIRDTLLPKLLSGEIDVSALADNTEANA